MPKIAMEDFSKYLGKIGEQLALLYTSFLIRPVNSLSITW